MAILIAGLILFCLLLVVILLVLAHKAKKRRKALAVKATEKTEEPPKTEPEKTEEAAPTPQTRPKDKYCMFCGKKNAGEAAFCDECAGKEFGDLESYLAKKEAKQKAQATKPSKVEEQQQALLDEAIEKEEKKTQATKKPAAKKSNPSLANVYEENETDKQAKYTGKWVVFRMYTLGNNEEDSEET